jgi:chemotaxis protein CheD
MALLITHHPSPIAEFPHIRRVRDGRFPHEIVSILPGEYFVSQEPLIIQTVLGSCVSVCVRDPLLSIGGMNHFMLPVPCEGGVDSWGESARYGCHAMELLVNEILRRGGGRDRLEVKVFGGGKIYDSSLDVGARNAVWVLEYLERERLKPIVADLRDVYPRKVYYFTESGRVLLKKIKRVRNRTIEERERRYHASLQQRRADGEVALF